MKSKIFFIVFAFICFLLIRLYKKFSVCIVFYFLYTLITVDMAIRQAMWFVLKHLVNKNVKSGNSFSGLLFVGIM